MLEKLTEYFMNEGWRINERYETGLLRIVEAHWDDATINLTELANKLEENTE